MGNHELGLADRNSLSWFNTPARRSLLRAKELLSAEVLAYLKTLPVNMTVNDCLLVHGCPPGSIKTYIFQVSLVQLARIFQKMESDLCMVGHTHELLLITYTDGRVDSVPLSKGIQTLAADSKYIVNVGSVGQPRDGNNHAKYVIWDSEARTLEVRFVPYNVKKTVEKIIALGLPKSHADRLW
jgi:diadenosine tetraphosphatase ApaH/serine/threonine PP2A family protein phosphatase